MRRRSVESVRPIGRLSVAAGRLIPTQAGDTSVEKQRRNLRGYGQDFRCQCTVVVQDEVGEVRRRLKRLCETFRYLECICELQEIVCPPTLRIADLVKFCVSRW